MALVKMIRAVPEVEGGNTVCEIPEEAVESAIRDGWSIAKAKEPAKEPAKEAPKTEPVKEEVKEAPKTTSAKGKKLRDE